MHDRTAGWTILAAAFLTLIAIAHHPTIHNAGPSNMLMQLNALSGRDRLMHGTVMVFVTALAFGFAVFSARLGLNRSAPLVALVAFSGSAIALIAAALIDGFLIPDVAQRYAGTDPMGMAVGNGLVAYGAIAIQELTKLAIVASSGAVCFWSIALLNPRHTRFCRVTGVLGLAAAGYTVVALGFTHRLGPHSLLGVAAAQYAWYVLSGIALVRGELQARAT